jgi:hypothetical protein
LIEPETIGEILESETPSVGKSFKSVPARCEFEHMRRGKILARFTVHYGDLTIRGFRVIEGGDGPWVGFPAVRKSGHNPKNAFVTTTWIIDESRRTAFRRWALACYATSCKQQPAPKPADAPEE